MSQALRQPLQSSHSAPTLPVQPARKLRTVLLVGFNAHMLAFARRAHASGIRVYLIDLVWRLREFVQFSNAVEPDGCVMEWSRVGTPEGLTAVRTFARKVQAEAILSSDDSVLIWLGKHRAIFEPEQKVLAPDCDVLDNLLDKGYQVERARQAGFELLPSWLITSSEILADIPDSAFPVVVRPTYMFSAYPAFKVKVLSSRHQLAEFYAMTRWTRPPVVQPYCQGPNLVLHGVRAENGDILAMRFFCAYRKYNGITASIAPHPRLPALEQAARRFVERENLIGAFHFELLRSDQDGTIYYLEVNCRLGGTTLRVMQLGYDEPNLMLAAYGLCPPRPAPPLGHERKATSLSLNLRQAANELRKRRDPLAYPRLSPLGSVYTSLRESLTVRDSLLSPNDTLSCLRYRWWHGK